MDLDDFDPCEDCNENPFECGGDPAECLVILAEEVSYNCGEAFE